MPKILILTSSWGYGHMSAAIGIRDHWDKKFKIQKINQTQIIDVMQHCHPLLNWIITILYNFIFKYIPKLFQILFNQSNQATWTLKILQTLSYWTTKKKLRQLIINTKPDIIVSTFPFWLHVIHTINLKLKHNFSLSTIITDSSHIHQSWIYEDISNYYFVSDQETKTILTQENINPNKIFPLGIPIRAQFFQQHHRSKTLHNFKLNPNIFTILYFLNNNTTKREEEILNKILINKHNFQVIIIVGGHKHFYHKLKNTTFKTKIVILNWVNNIAEIMQASDLIITKAGGASTAEAINNGKPIFFSRVLLQETGNADFVINNTFGKNIQTLSPIKAADLIKKTASFNNEEYKNLLKHAKLYQNSNKSPQIIEILTRKKSNN